MPKKFDPYYKWLGIAPDEHPISHYRLLGIREFEHDPEVIQVAANRQMAHVQQFKLSKHTEESQKLLNELSKAMVCLLNEEKKARYDRKLRKKRESKEAEAATPPVDDGKPPAQEAARTDTATDSTTKATPEVRKPSPSAGNTAVVASVAGVVLLAGVLYWVFIAGATAGLPDELKRGLVLHYNCDRQEQEVTDQSGTGNHGTPTGATWKKSTDDARSGVYELDGQDDLISIPPATIGNWEQLTLSVWINLPHIEKPINQYFPAFIGSYTTNPGVNIGIHLFDWDRGLMGGEVDTDRGNVEITGGTLLVPWNEWFHAAMAYDGTTVTIYLNGEAGGSLPASGKLKTPTALAAGTHDSVYGLLRGTVDDVMIFNRALSEKEIIQLYTLQGGSSPPSSIETGE